MVSIFVNLETFVYYTPTWLQISDSCNTKAWNKAAAKFPSPLFIAQPFVTIRNLSRIKFQFIKTLTF